MLLTCNKMLSCIYIYIYIYLIEAIIIHNEVSCKIFYQLMNHMIKVHYMMCNTYIEPLGATMVS